MIMPFHLPMQKGSALDGRVRRFSFAHERKSLANARRLVEVSYY